MTATSPVTPTAEQIQTIRVFCAHCHVFPEPKMFPREAWHEEVTQGFRLFYDSPTEGLEIPPEDVTIAWFESLAPEKVDLPVESGKVETTTFRLDTDASEAVHATSVSCVRLDADRSEIWASDMRDASILSAQGDGVFTVAARPLELANPCRITSVDLDGDGVREVLASDLGSFLPADHQRGAIWAFSPEEDWKAEPVLGSAARVSDVQPGDFDGDGDQDLVVAAFGWRRTGSVLVLWNDGNGKWLPQVVDDRHGAIDVPVVDLNSDGSPDFVTVLAQEHETVVAYINQKNGEFKPVTLYGAADPAFGSSGIQLTDFDSDGDVDILHTNGDSFDDGRLKPFHGIRWLENQGEYRFEPHELTSMPGVHQAVAGDIDLDGDNDVVAVSLLPPRNSSSTETVASIIWLEQTAEGQFTRHVVEINDADHADCALLDRDHDGDLDLCVTHFRWTEDKGAAVSWFENQTKFPSTK